VFRQEPEEVHSSRELQQGLPEKFWQSPRDSTFDLIDFLPGCWTIDFESVILDTMPFGSIDGPLPSPNPSFGGFQYLVSLPFLAGKSHF
jgi:hypothetical protein